jgi:hypothetical protein
VHIGDVVLGVRYISAIFRQDGFISLIFPSLLTSCFSLLCLFFSFIFPLFMGWKVTLGDTVVICGGNDKGKLAVVTDLTPKMVYLKFKCSGETTRVMLYNVTLLHDDLLSHTSMQVDQPEVVQQLRFMQDSINSLPCTITSNDGTSDYSKEIIQEIINLKGCMNKLVSLLQALHLK